MNIKVLAMFQKHNLNIKENFKKSFRLRKVKTINLANDQSSRLLKPKKKM